MADVIFTVQFSDSLLVQCKPIIISGKRLYTHTIVTYADTKHTMFTIELVWCIWVWILLMEGELLTLPEHHSSLPVYSGVRVAKSLVCLGVVCFCFFCFFPLIIICLFSISFGHYMVCLFVDLRFRITNLLSYNFFCIRFKINER